MKKEKKELLRLQTIIENDRMKTNENFSELIICDLNKLLNDYFDYKQSPSLEIQKVGDKFKVDISIIATRIKAFGILNK